MADNPTCPHNYEPRYDERPVQMITEWGGYASVKYKIVYEKLWMADVCRLCGHTIVADRGK